MSYDYFDRYAEMDEDAHSALPPAMGTGDEAWASDPVEREEDEGPEPPRRQPILPREAR